MVTREEKFAKVAEKLKDREYRLTCGLFYRIVDTKAKNIPFIPTEQQVKILTEDHPLLVVLKARQLGISTSTAIDMLDFAMNTPNVSCGIIDQTLPDAKSKLEKIKFAFENLPKAYAAIMPSVVTSNTEEIVFSNGSKIKVGTSHRGGTLNYLWISEFANICKMSPLKAREIMTGALNTIDLGQRVMIESTANGSEGAFYDICQKALVKNEWSPLDYKAYFFPWFEDRKYTLEMPNHVVIPDPVQDYRRKLESHGIKLTDNQVYWYLKKQSTIGEDIKQEFPSTPEEAFESSDEDKYFADLVRKAKKEGRVCHFEIEPSLPVYTAWDLGRSDLTAIVFYQLVGREIRIIDYYENNGEHFTFYLGVLRDKGYRYGALNLPHDAKIKTIRDDKSCEDMAIDAGFEVHIIPRVKNKSLAVSSARKMFPEVFFKESKTTLLLQRLEKYRKKWSEQLGRYTTEFDDVNCHGADAFMGIGQEMFLHNEDEDTSDLEAQMEEMYANMYD